MAPRPDVLFLTHRVPYPPDKGDRIRTYHLLKSLATWADVHLACLADEPVDPRAMDRLGRYCERMAVVPLKAWSRRAGSLASLAVGKTATEGAFWSSRLGRVVRRWAGETRFHAAVASASSMVPYLRLSPLRQVPAIVDLVDVDSEKWLDYAKSRGGLRRWLYRVEGTRLRRLERSLPRWAHAVTLVSESEAELYRAFGGSDGVHAVTNGVDLASFRPVPREHQTGCVFVGTLDYWPNIEGICWFCHEVWPAVRAAQPSATLSLVGRRPVEEVRRLSACPGVEVVGQVPDVRPYLNRAAVAIAPLRIARGVQNKVLEAMAMAKPVVASPQALEGLRASPGKHLLSASSPHEWARSIDLLLGDASLRRRLGSAARAYVEEYHDWDACLEPFGRLLRAIPREGASPDGRLDEVVRRDAGHARDPLAPAVRPVR